LHNNRENPWTPRATKNKLPDLIEMLQKGPSTLRGKKLFKKGLNSTGNNTGTTPGRSIPLHSWAIQDE
jgi:hypothetical protein